VGKSEIALQLAERLDGEIVSADSRLFYRGMDIGTAKPTLEERSRVPHHLIDVAGPDQP
jgi:tRNA dimethylallyltransferase